MGETNGAGKRNTCEAEKGSRLPYRDTGAQMSRFRSLERGSVSPACSLLLDQHSEAAGLRLAIPGILLRSYVAPWDLPDSLLDFLE